MWLGCELASNTFSMMSSGASDSAALIPVRQTSSKLCRHCTATLDWSVSDAGQKTKSRLCASAS